METKLTRRAQKMVAHTAVTESATMAKLTNRAQRMVAHTAVMEFATMVKPLRRALRMVAWTTVNAKRDTFQIVLTMTAAMRTGSETESVTVKIKAGDVICLATTAKCQTALNQQLLHQCAVMASATAPKLMKLAHKMVALLLVNALKVKLLIARATATAAQKVG